MLVCIGTGALIVSHGGSWSMFWSLKGVIMVFGGTISVVFMAMPMDKLKQVPGYVRRFMSNKQMGLPATVATMGRLSDKARRDGILSLEHEIEKVDDPFLQQSLKMAVDGSDAHVIESTMRMELMAMQERHKAGKKFFDLVKLYGPGYGLAATLIGQIGMFGSLGTGGVDELGAMLAVAVTATLYGTLLANAVAGPIGDKLSLRSGEEIMSKEMMLQGVLSIHAGDNPRATFEKMLAFVPRQQRLKLKAA
ncbi:MAG: MotA/TolQ/ExbB proton channel family protein [Planctomycetota bacterium]|nr:MotA/TolQ/ExbB proton channel family protein [Planctomycetota bacterium]MEC9232301.1 MotA/TolQ/ExbB proton channel family protein [Planctomycetota bacterium]MED6307469.1 MotA/TolQ/ExbB proton channel family protein [Planctomycetota bacterium]